MPRNVAHPTAVPPMIVVICGGYLRKVKIGAALAARGRHDPCVLPRAVPMVEAMAALVLCDHALRQRALCG